MNYICFERKNTKVVWGIGKSRSSARADTLKFTPCYYGNNFVSLCTIEADKSVIDYINKYKGANVPWIKKTIKHS